MALCAECERFSGLYRPTRGLRKYIYSNIRATFGKLLKGTESQKPPEILERMLMVYNETRRTKSVLNLFGTDEEQVLYYLLEKCFLWQIEDSSLVAKVLINIYQRVGHFSELYRFLIWRSALGAADVDILEKTLSISLQDVSNEIGMIAYFLHHATESKLMFNGVRFIDLSIFVPRVTPCVFSIMEARPNLLLLLLRYGATIETDCTLGTISIAQVLRHLLGTLWSTLRDATDDVVNSDETNDKKKLLCAQYLLRAIPQLKGGCLNGMLVGTTGIPDKTRLADATQYVRHLNDMKFVPFLANRYFGPSDLQHLYRCAIRKVLWTNWNLPRGIKTLPIHAFLADYLDLLTN